MHFGSDSGYACRFSDITSGCPVGRGMHAECCGEAGSNAVTAPAYMIFPKPSEEQIRSAHVITFFDPQRPEYHRVVVDTLDRSERTPIDLLVIDIPVDSTDSVAVCQWLGSIAALRRAAST